MGHPDAPATATPTPRSQDARARALVLCVTGMHRSGTSLVASWLARCGLTLDDGQVYGATEGNPKGHFEDKEFVDLQAARLLALSRRSRGWIHTAPAPPGTDERFEQTARALIAERDRKFALWGWKDPRTVLFLEFWRRAIPGLKTLLLWRPCAEVVTSLVDRARASDKPDYQIGSVRAVKTWRAYNERVLAYKNDHPQDTVLLPLHALLRDDRAALARIQGRLGLPLEHRPIAEVFEPELLQARAPSLLQRAAMRHWGADTLAAALDQASDRV